MPAGPRQNALRAYSRVVAPFICKYGVPPLPRDPKLDQVAECHRRLLRKVHPDKGGTPDDFRAVRSAKEVLDAALRAAEEGPPPPAPREPPGINRKRPAAAPPRMQKKPAAASGSAGAASTPPTSSALVVLAKDMCPFCAETADGPARCFRIQSNGVLLTYNGLQLADPDTWDAFKQWIQTNKKDWTLLYFCQTMELCRRRRRHLHLMVQFRAAVDWPSSRFAFRGILPNARPTWGDYCQQGRQKKNPQQCLNRGFFYVFANKIGTCLDSDGALCVHGNYGPYWTDNAFLYEVLGDWPEKLWKRYQLTHKQYGEYLTLCRDRVPGRKRNLEEQRSQQGLVM